MNIARIHMSLTAATAIAACFVASSALAAVIATNNFETAWDGFTASAGSMEDMAALTAYNDDRPSASAPYPFPERGGG